MIKLTLGNVPDLPTKEALQAVETFLQGDTLLRSGFKLLEINIEKAVSGLNYPHNLGYTPRDVIVTSAIGSGVVSWNYANFTNTNLVLSTTGAVNLRVLVGSYR